MTSSILLGVLLLSLFLGRPNYAAAASAGTQTIFGAEMNQLTPAQGLDQMVAANTTWTRRNAVLWSVVEPTEGAARNWAL